MNLVALPPAWWQLRQKVPLPNSFVCDSWQFLVTVRNTAQIWERAALNVPHALANCWKHKISFYSGGRILREHPAGANAAGMWSGTGVQKQRRDVSASHHESTPTSQGPQWVCMQNGGLAFSLLHNQPCRIASRWPKREQRCFPVQTFSLQLNLVSVP